jgi:hypothetical protein
VSQSLNPVRRGRWQSRSFAFRLQRRFPDSARRGQTRQRLLGTQKWLISKDEGRLEGDNLVPDTEEARESLKTLGAKPEHIRGDRFKAAPRENAPEKKKPTPAQKRAQQPNIKKAQAARRS